MTITILTPTYNRAYVLEKLYNSLTKQNKKNFEWFIVDDGSKDNTKEIVQNFISENKIKIRYLYQKNGGKHRALNNGIKNIESELTFIVDSDDFLSKDAIEKINFYYEKYKMNKKICSYSFLRGFPDGKINGPEYRQHEFIGDYIKDRLNNHNNGDKAEVYITKYLKEIPFLEIKDEKFFNEGYVWTKLALKYDTVYINEVIYYGEYLKDGLTKNMLKIRAQNPIGMIETCKVVLNNNEKANLKLKIKVIIKYIAYNKIAKKSIIEQYKNVECKGIFILNYILGCLYYFYIKIKIGESSNGKKDKYHNSGI